MTRWIPGLKAGESEAVRQLWERYAGRLVRLARRRLGYALRRATDEEDVALSVFHSLCRGARAGRFSRIGNRDELWWLLLAITKRKAVSQLRYESQATRGGARVVTEADLRQRDDRGAVLELDDLVSEEPTPEFLTILNDEHARLLALLRDDQLRRIATLRIEGYQNSEIAEREGIAVRSVERKLSLIRSKWTKELDRERRSANDR